ncbi:auxin-responsive protein IAA27-like [Carica papaya]|uniref:auxin-responsive protein IAA27-like n=1 Tax=Carica papaya TaxID=3649 RepID=UPI000B8C71EF|nr:auxin-responsive protein IAA27-like [Carica papaya]
MAKSDKNNRKNCLNFKATELRLGLPGSESPDRDDADGNWDLVVLSLNSYAVSGAKRGFCDAINGGRGSAKWVISSGSEAAAVDLGAKGPGGSAGMLFSPRGAAMAVGGSSSGLGGSVVKDGAVPQSPKLVGLVQDKKTQDAGPGGHGLAPASK